MLIKTKGYPLDFIQTHPVTLNDADSHLRSYVFKFNSPRTKLHYIVRAELHENDFFAIKFYAKKDRGSDRKYNNVIDKGDVANILVTSAKVIPYLLVEFPLASFGFFGSRTLDLKSDKIEDYTNNQRYRLYEYHIPQLIGTKTFAHFSYQKGSAYGLVNQNCNNIMQIEKKIREMLTYDYPDLVEINP